MTAAAQAYTVPIPPARSEVEVASDVVIALMATKWLKVTSAARLATLASDLRLRPTDLRDAWRRADRGVPLSLDRRRRVTETGQLPVMVDAAEAVEAGAELADVVAIEATPAPEPEPEPAWPALARRQALIASMDTKEALIAAMAARAEPATAKAVPAKRRVTRHADMVAPLATASARAKAATRRESGGVSEKWCPPGRHWAPVADFKEASARHPGRLRFACEPHYQAYQRTRYLTVAERGAVDLSLTFVIGLGDACVDQACPGCAKPLLAGELARAVTQRVFHADCDTHPTERDQ